MAFLLKKEVSAEPTGYPERNYELAINSSVVSPHQQGRRLSGITERRSLANHSILPMPFLEVLC